ncbi:MAG: polysulfide reductase NrfD [Minicystis sp.]
MSDATPVRPAEFEDGRDIDPARGELCGEGAQMKVKAPEHAYPARRDVEHRVPSEGGRADVTYYDQPVIKAPVWIWSVPAYLFVGGIAGATSALAAAAEVIDPRANRRLIRTAHLVSMSGEVMSAGFLIYDLGRPARFLNMLRVFRPTSPMNLGTWILSASGAASTAAVLFGGRKGALGRVGKAAGYAAGALGLPLAGYTAVLFTSTAVPVWQGGHRALPPLFLASSAATAGALVSMLPVGRRGRAAARRFAAFGNAAALAASVAFEMEVARSPRAARPLRRGVSGVLWNLARGLTGASLVTNIAAGHGRRRAVSHALALAGGLGMRVSVFLAGRASAHDPRATFRQQRAGLGAAEVTETANHPPRIEPGPVMART